MTGATGAIGRELTREFLARGHTVIATSRSVATLEAMRAEFTDLPGVFEPWEVNLLSLDAGSLVGELAARGLSPDHLVNSARDLASLRLQADGWPDRESWRAEFELGVLVPVTLTVGLADAPKGCLRSVVNVGSIYGVVAMNQRLYDNPSVQAPPHYGVVKAALVHVTKELAVRLAPRGIRVNAISYGGVEGRADARFRARYAKLAPIGRMLRRDEIFAPLEFLLMGPDALTGHNLVVDGGWTIW